MSAFVWEDIEAECIRTIERGEVDESFRLSRRHRWRLLAVDVHGDDAVVVVATRGKRSGGEIGSAPVPPTGRPVGGAWLGRIRQRRSGPSVVPRFQRGVVPGRVPGDERGPQAQEVPAAQARARTTWSCRSPRASPRSRGGVDERQRRSMASSLSCGVVGRCLPSSYSVRAVSGSARLAGQRLGVRSRRCRGRHVSASRCFDGSTRTSGSTTCLAAGDRFRSVRVPAFWGTGTQHSLRWESCGDADGTWRCRSVRSC